MLGLQVLRRLRCQGLSQLQTIKCREILSRCASSSPADSPFGDLIRTESEKRVPLPGYEAVDKLENADDNVRKIFDLEFASRKEKSKHEMASIVEKYRRCEGDTGSLEVQVATLSLRIKLLTEHLQLHRKDKSCLQRLIQLVQRRRRLLLKMKEFKPNTYHYALTGLHLKPPTVWKYQYKNNKKIQGKGKRAKYVKQRWEDLYNLEYRTK